MKESRKESKIPALAAVLTLCVFAVCVLGVLLMGAKSYRAVAGSGDAQYARRTAGQYLSTRIRQGGEITLEDFGEGCALVFRETAGETVYVTRVYCHGGYLRQLYARAEGEFSPEAGEKILEAESLALETEGELLRVILSFADGAEQMLVFNLREGVSP